MSERIDEHWEYWMPSEEMAEAFPDAHVFDRNAAGYRRGNPNWCVFRYGRPKPDRLEKLDEWVSCPTCHESFKKLRCPHIGDHAAVFHHQVLGQALASPGWP